MFDHFSRFVVTVPIPDKSARTVCSNIYAGWIAKFGCPESIRTDAGTEFTSSLLTNMMKKMGVHVRSCTHITIRVIRWSASTGPCGISCEQN